MKAAVRDRYGPPSVVEVEDVDVSVPAPDQVLVRVRAASVNRADLDNLYPRWQFTRLFLGLRKPRIRRIGLDVAGVVESVGPSETRFRPGDEVFGDMFTVGQGAFAEYVSLPMTNVWHHWSGIYEEVAAIFDPFGNAVHTALAFPVLGEDVLVSGAGPIGLMATAVARHAGARHVVVSEPNAYRRELASKMGATLTIDPRERPLESVFAELDMVEGFDVALEMSGNATALRAAIGSMAHGGGIAILGIPSEEIAIDVNAIVFKQLTLRGIYGREMYETWYKMTVMLQSGLDITPAITHRFGFRDFEAAFAAARAGDSGKVIMDWTT